MTRETGVTQEFDPHRDTVTEVGEVREEAFSDWPTRNLADPIGEIQGFRRLAAAVHSSSATRRVRIAGWSLAIFMVATTLLTLLWGLFGY